MNLPDSRIEKLVKSISAAVTPELTLEIKQLKQRLSKVTRQRDQYLADSKQLAFAKKQRDRYRAKADQYQKQLVAKERNE